MGFSSIRSVVDNAYDKGQNVFTSFRKLSANASAAYCWSDLSMAPGNPKPNYYLTAELVSSTLDYRAGIWHGGPVAPKTKHLHTCFLQNSIAGGAPAVYLLCDYLLFYPIIDMDSTDEQYFFNTVSLPRYSDGNGVQAFLVAVTPYMGGGGFTIKYTNEKGAAGQISRPCLSNAATFIGTLVNSRDTNPPGAPFIPLAQDDNGIRSVESITFNAPNGGLAALVLVKVIATMMTREITAASEFDFIKDKMSFPRVYDGAYLNFLCCPSGTIATGIFTGTASFIWN